VSPDSNDSLSKHQPMTSENHYFTMKRIRLAANLAYFKKRSETPVASEDLLSMLIRIE